VTAADIPGELWRAAGVDPGDVIGIEIEQFLNGTGAASGQVHLVTAGLRGGGSLRVVRKTFEPVESGPHAHGSRSSAHWAHWRRELTAYRSGILPAGPGLRAPRLVTVIDDTLYVEYVGEDRPEVEEAALALGRWHHHDRTSQRPWLAQDQLAQRLAVTELDWSAVEIDRRVPIIWDRRQECLARLATIPHGIAHGDFSSGNLRATGADVVALDWATLGISPLGFDLAHLALATLNERLLPVYLDGLQGRYDATSVSLGYRGAVSLVGASRAHWMASRSIPLPAGYVDFLHAHQT
jgi:hypothetical protein